MSSLRKLFYLIFITSALSISTDNDSHSFFFLNGILINPVTCNILDYGDRADNKTDLGIAIMEAFNKCILNNLPGSILVVQKESI